MQIKSLKCRITTLSPLLVTSNTGDPNMVSTKEYISGTVILGALAGMYIRKNNLADAHKDNSFCNWFLNGSLKFTNAYIVSYDDKKNIKDNLPIPISIQKDKDNESDIYDLLRDEVDKTTKIIGGFGKIEKDLLYEQKIGKSVNFHHERDPLSGTTKKGMIFNYESIDAGQKFESVIIGEDGEVRNLLNFFGGNFEINIGRSRSAQYGKVKFEFLKPEDIPVNSASGEISLTLLSDTLIYNEQGFSTTDKKDFENVLRKKLENSVEVKKAFIKTGEIENFVSVWKLRKPSETCFLMGSCFLISGANDAEKLKELQINGIGERTHEGFGRVAIGIQTEKKLTKRDYGEAPISSGILPKIAKEIAKEAVKNYIRKTIEAKAMEECAEFKELPTKSLISRLEMAVKSNQEKKPKREEYLEKLRDTAKDKLRKCHNSNDTLLEFLKNKEVGIDENIMRDIRPICNELAFTPANDTDFLNSHFMNSLYKSYFETFFSAMRKAKKMEKEV